jgi:nitrite reductase/ring-hydroxylating ferredoxin subunit
VHRKEFIKTCGFACIGGGILGSFLAGCTSMKMINGVIAGSDLVVPVAAFHTKDDTVRKYVTVHHEQLKYPVCVYRFSDTDYTALFMRCPHQGAELQVFGDRLECPAHGSEFNNKGVVQTGPADTNLRTFPVVVSGDQLKISLK